MTIFFSSDPTVEGNYHILTSFTLVYFYGRRTDLRNAFGSVLDPYPDLTRSLDADLDWESVSGTRTAKMTHKNKKKLRNFMFF